VPQAVSYGLIGVWHRGQISFTVGIVLLCLRLVASTPPTTAAKPAPTPMISIGISRSNCPRGEPTVLVVVVEFEFAHVLVALANVVLLVVVVKIVVVSDTYMIMGVPVRAGVSNVDTIEIVKAKSRSGLIWEEAILSSLVTF
jgi:hypothetical protein